MKKSFKILQNGVLNENPTFRMVLGMCPTLAVTTSAENALGMGLATTFVLIGSNVFISMLRKIIPDKIRIPAYITVIAGFVTIIELMLKAYLPELNESLGLFIPLIVVNCIIMARAEAYANKNTVWDSFVDGLGMGIGFTLSLTLIGTVREILGAGSIFGHTFIKGEMQPILIFLLPPGGFMILGFLMGLINKITDRTTPIRNCGSCPMNCVERVCEKEVEA
ncbi:MAG TPA: electron transport complex subunit RsxE [Clostridiales bacterium]|nr:electron transport complex subunit RsxE [Clostridiales bacterium]